jgi:NAD-dependent dihydropyrimidine dehydrogenase PreA subunit
MLRIDPELCVGCKLCARECPTGAIRMDGRKAVSGDGCASCALCVRLCDKHAITLSFEPAEKRVRCGNCPVECAILEGFTGACRRYRNLDGQLVLDRPLLVPAHVGPRTETVLDPLLTGVGAGTTSPCFTPAPYIVQESFDGVDVVTVVSEVPFSYSGLKLKVDTNLYLGEEGARVRREGRPIGMVETEEYGSKMLALGGVNSFHGPYGCTAARTISELCNGGEVDLKVENGARVRVRVGGRPLVDGVLAGKMRVGCGSAATAMFAPYFAQVADEVLVLDPGITGLFSEHMAGRALGKSWSGVTPVGRKSTIGRYFGEAGQGLGGTCFTNPREAIESIDPAIARPGMTLFVTDTAGESGFLFRLDERLELEELPLNSEAFKVMELMQENAEDARVSALFMAGAGGSARSGVTKFPIKLNQAVHAGLVRLTMGSAPVFLLPGGGITFAVDVEKLPAGAITWVPTPALVAPVEYTMTREVYARVEGHIEAIRPRQEVLAERRHIIV